MKYFLSILSIVGIVLIFVFCPKVERKEEFLRIHIRANSNLQEDQMVKYQVKDAVVDALIPVLSEVESFDEAKNLIETSFSLIEDVAKGVLQNEGFTYSASASLKKEYFPARSYDKLTLEEGEYEALILNLGSGEGNNWWCLVYPAFCFTSSTKSSNIVYISKIWEIIKNITREE